MHARQNTFLSHSTIVQMLQSVAGLNLSPVALVALADDICPYLLRSRRPVKEALSRIANHYLRDGDRVRELLAAPASPAWQSVLEHVVTFARMHTMFPQDEATSCPDLDAYEDIRSRLLEYNFEGSFDAWMGVVITSRLRRYWRDSHALRAGGGGFLTPVERAAAEASGERESRVQLLSLDIRLREDEPVLADSLPAAMLPIEEAVEATELHRFVTAEVAALASRDDPLLAEVWYAVFDRRMRLREAAECYGLTVSQAHRRVERVRSHLQQSSKLRQWLDGTL